MIENNSRIEQEEINGRIDTSSFIHITTRTNEIFILRHKHIFAFQAF